MKRMITGASLLALSSVCAQADGLDRSGQSVSSIFAADGTVTTTFGLVMPNVTGKDLAGNSYDAGKDYSVSSLSFTNALNDRFNYSVILDQPYGADVFYDNDPLTTALGGTLADVDSTALTFVGRYKINDRFSVFGGIGVERIDANVALNGQAYAAAISTAAVASRVPGLDSALLGKALRGDLAAAGAIDGAYGAGTTAALGARVRTAVAGFNATDGYSFRMEDSTKPTYLIGAAYEIPDIALRIAGTYRFETKHSAKISESLLGTDYDGSTPGYDNTIDFVTPRSFNLDFQTGIAAGTLLTASYRWSEFSQVNITPTVLGRDLVTIEDGHRYTLGVARQFNDQFSASLTYIFEPEDGEQIVSPLAPTDGVKGISLGGRYKTDRWNVSGGLSYLMVTDAYPGVADRKVARFTDNSIVAIGFKAEMSF
ncbi:outer membrane protein transport protein [Maliponia aquimaris]|uniref:Outer membrane protein transport protein (OMPP1/FadL/TodX) n=1 Tax=Maliponia aquimaris TaxID=1673631 RepID=A0A238L8Z2_9RHOB|nr:outer membrane protein transport protein [Maliponia aquimaris]SMX50842.1 Outer membrane protein transport protein (OMPP1/FadL/TodX) [Maliponia aquimaris]